MFPIFPAAQNINIQNANNVSDISCRTKYQHPTFTNINFKRPTMTNITQNKNKHLANMPGWLYESGRQWPNLQNTQPSQWTPHTAPKYSDSPIVDHRNPLLQCIAHHLEITKTLNPTNVSGSFLRWTQLLS